MDSPPDPERRYVFDCEYQPVKVKAGRLTDDWSIVAVSGWLIAMGFDFKVTDGSRGLGIKVRVRTGHGPGGQGVWAYADNGDWIVTETGSDGRSRIAVAPDDVFRKIYYVLLREGEERP